MTRLPPNKSLEPTRASRSDLLKGRRLFDISSPRGSALVVRHHYTLMQKEIFHEHLIRATGHSVECARGMVRNGLPESFQYIVRLNQSYDDNPLKQGERIFPDDVARHGASVGPLPAEQVVELLWREGMVPEWIDISVTRADATHTFLELLCCGRFSDHGGHLYYSQTDVCPFGCKSPYLPPSWKPGDAPFDLDWRVSRDA